MLVMPAVLVGTILVLLALIVMDDDTQRSETLYATGTVCIPMLLAAFGGELYVRSKYSDADKDRERRLRGRPRDLRAVEQWLQDSRNETWIRTGRTESSARPMPCQPLFKAAGELGFMSGPGAFAWCPVSIWPVRMVMPAMAEKVFEQQGRVDLSDEFAVRHCAVLYGKAFFEWLTTVTGEFFPMLSVQTRSRCWIAQDPAKWIEWWETLPEGSWPAKAPGPEDSGANS